MLPLASFLHKIMVAIEDKKIKNVTHGVLLLGIMCLGNKLCMHLWW